jgi:phage replication initiation protein
MNRTTVDYLSFSFDIGVLFTAYQSGQYIGVNLLAPGWHYDLSLDEHQFVTGIVNRYLADIDASSSLVYVSRQDAGLHGYTSSGKIIDQYGRVCGAVGYGGNRGTCYIGLTGQGCQQSDMNQCKKVIEQLNGKITRIDLALDLLDGQVTMQDAIDGYYGGDFGSGGRQPSAQFIDDMGSSKGRTLYVGRVANGKTTCIYEKGKQLGDSDSSWLRIEARIGNKDRFIPTDSIIETDEYFAGSSHFASRSLAKVKDEFQFITRIKTEQKKSEIAYDRMVKYARISYGKLIKTMTRTMWPEQIIEVLFRNGTPRRLLGGVDYLNQLPFGTLYSQDEIYQIDEAFYAV